MAQEEKSGILIAEELKSGGFIPQRQKDLVVIRCRAPGGRVSADKLRKLADVVTAQYISPYACLLKYFMSI